MRVIFKLKFVLRLSKDLLVPIWLGRIWVMSKGLRWEIASDCSFHCWLCHCHGKVEMKFLANKSRKKWFFDVKLIIVIMSEWRWSSISCLYRLVEAPTANRMTERENVFVKYHIKFMDPSSLSALHFNRTRWHSWQKRVWFDAQDTEAWNVLLFEMQSRNLPC